MPVWGSVRSNSEADSFENFFFWAMRLLSSVTGIPVPSKVTDSASFAFLNLKWITDIWTRLRGDAGFLFRAETKFFFSSFFLFFSLFGFCSAEGKKIFSSSSSFFFFFLLSTMSRDWKGREREREREKKKRKKKKKNDEKKKRKKKIRKNKQTKKQTKHFLSERD